MLFVLELFDLPSYVPFFSSLLSNDDMDEERRESRSEELGMEL